MYLNVDELPRHLEESFCDLLDQIERLKLENAELLSIINTLEIQLEELRYV